MLANKQEISCNGSGLSSRRRVLPTANVQTKADAFATTHWSLVLIAQGQSAAAEEALEELCRIYCCFNVSLIGVLLALFAGAKPSNPGPVISVTPGSLSVTVRSQCKL